MIISNLVSGLGNQLFQYSIGRQISLIHNVPLKLDISFFRSNNIPYAYDQLTRSFKLGHYKINAAIANESEIENYKGRYSKKTLHSKLYTKVVKVIPRYKRQYFEELEWWVYDKELFKVNANVYLNGYWQHYKYLQSFPSQIMEELTLKENYQNIYKNDIEHNAESVSVHIRRGDYVEDGLFALQSIEYYKSAIALLKKKIKNPKFYIFSDDMNWVKANINIDAHITLVENQKDFIDLDLMSKCRHNIIANSSFSWWGAMFNKNPDKIVITPSRWVLPDEINNRIELAFPSWIKI